MPTVTLPADRVALVPVTPYFGGRPVPFDQSSMSCTSDDINVALAALDSTGKYCVIFARAYGRATVHMIDAGVDDIAVTVDGPGGPHSTDIPDALIVSAFSEPAAGRAPVIPELLLPPKKITPAQLGPDSAQLVEMTRNGTPIIRGTAIDASAAPALHRYDAAATPPISTAVNPAANPNEPIAGVGDTTLSQNTAAAPPTPAGGGTKVVEQQREATEAQGPKVMRQPSTDGRGA